MHLYIFTNIYKHKLLFASGISMIASLIILYWKTNNDTQWCISKTILNPIKLINLVSRFIKKFVNKLEIISE